MNYKNRFSMISMIGLGAAITSGEVVAQTPAPVATGSPVDKTTGGELTDIVVTAQKRSERLQDVPVAVAAFGSDQLASANVTSAMDLQRAVPALTLTSSAAGVLPFLRGIGNPSTTPGNEPSTALYIDGVYYPSLPNSMFNLNNVERVEILKGPQGTLFGRNAVGGLIQIITRDPSFDPTGSIKLGYGSFQTFNGSFYASTGLTDSVAADIAVQGQHQGDGWGRNIVTGSQYGYDNNIAARTKWLFELGADTTVKLAANYQKSKTTIGFPVATYRGTIQAAPSAPTVPLTPIGFYDARNNDGNIGRNESYGFSGQLQHDLGFAQFTSLTAWHKQTQDNLFDFDYTSDNFFLLNNKIKNRVFSQELRLNSRSGSPVTWTVGAYYSNVYALAGPTIFQGTLFGVNKPTSYASQVTKSFAGFGQATVPLGSRTNITGGIRYSNDKLTGNGHNDVQTPTSYIVGAPVPTKKASYERVNFKLSADHHFSDDVMLYASYSTGYKAGTYNLAAADGQPPADPEEIKAWEAGLKTQFLDNRLRFNAAAFHYKISGPQVQIRNGAAFQLINAGSARSQGIEFDGQALLADGLNLRFGAAYLDAVYTDFKNAPIVTQRTVTPPFGNTPFAVFDAKGFDITRAPKYTANVGMDYSVESSAGRFQLTANYAYSGRFFWTVDHQIQQKAYGLLDAQLSYKLPNNDAWQFRLWGKNLTDVQYYAFATESAVLAGFTGAPAAPRTYGVSAEYIF